MASTMVHMHEGVKNPTVDDHKGKIVAVTMNRITQDMMDSQDHFLSARIDIANAENYLNSESRRQNRNMPEVRPASKQQPTVEHGGVLNVGDGLAATEKFPSVGKTLTKTLESNRNSDRQKESTCTIANNDMDDNVFDEAIQKDTSLIESEDVETNIPRKANTTKDAEDNSGKLKVKVKSLGRQPKDIFCHREACKERP